MIEFGKVIGGLNWEW